MTGAASSDPRLRLLLDSAVPFELPLALPFRGVTKREGVLLRGPSGWGEFAPFVEYNPRTTARWLSSAIEAAWGSWPSPQRTSVPVNAVVPAVTAPVAADLTTEAVELDGCTTIKVKVAQAGQDLADDLARVAAVRAALRACDVRDGRIRVDANAAWGVDEASVAITELDAAAEGLEYVEQPCRSLDELAALRGAVTVPIAADESIRSAADPAAAVRAGKIDIAVVKVPPLGGVWPALRVAQACGVPVVVSGAMDSAVGLASAVALAAAVQDLPMACGLGTGALLAEDLVGLPLRPSGGRLPVRRWDPQPEALASASDRVPGPRRDWWLRRLTRAWESGANQYAGELIKVSQ